MFPENVDTETGTVELWVIPTEPAEELLKKDTITAEKMAQKPAEIDGFAVLKSAQGKVLVLDAQDKIVAESS
jgi:hypothetical protein